MADWFRNTSWSPEIEQEFFRRFARARQKRQLLRIQCTTLLDADARRFAPDVLRLLDHYPGKPDSEPAQPIIYDSDRVAYLVVRAQARHAVRDLVGAVADYRELIAYQRATDHLGTWGEEHRFALMVLEGAAGDLFEEAYDVLCEVARTQANPFPKQRFDRALACARLAHRLGRPSEAARHATEALAETGIARTELRYHAHLGLVQSVDPGVLDELRWLADPASRH